MLRQQSCRHLVANDRSRRRLIGSQAGIGCILRLKEIVEPKRQQAESNAVRRDGNADRRSRSVYTITGHRALHLPVPDDPVAER
jgi:hypothetical protein